MAMRVSNDPSAPWILANAAGFVMGGAIAAVVVLAGEEPLVGTVRSQASAAAALAPLTAVSMGLFGGLVGLAQWLVLQRWWSISRWWIAATAGGWAAAGAIAGTLSGFLSGTVTGVGPGIGVAGYLVGTAGSVAAIGLVPGVLQSLVIRRRVAVLSWVAAHLAGTLAGFAVGFPVMLTLASIFQLNLPSAEAWVVAGLLWGAMFGIVTSRSLERAMASGRAPEGVRPGEGSATA
jgi:hypothetical protein